MLTIMRRLYLLLASCIFICMQLSAQDQSRVITGKVINDKGIGLPGASITVKGGGVGTTANSDGTFSITVPSTAKALIITSVGYEQREFSLGKQSTITISLQSTDASMQ